MNLEYKNPLILSMKPADKNLPLLKPKLVDKIPPLPQAGEGRGEGEQRMTA